ncbi:MAG: flagellar hook-associated protein FlgK [Magnetospirillum sp.]|nr:flagellar hook-associated protein FlgK [Magnetospirillum sp.]
MRALQTRMAVATNNIANADNVNYTAKSANQATRINGGVGTGVDVIGIGSNVDANLVRSIVGATSTNAAAQTFLDYIQALSNSLGSLSSDGAGDTLATHLSSLESTLDELATTPESATLKGQAVTDLEDAAATLRASSDEVQTLRGNADDAIADAVDTVNDALHQIDALNESIARAQAAGKSTADLEDQRNAALQTVAEQLDISYFTDSTGAMKVYTASGQVLVGAEVHELSFTAAGTVNAGSTYPGTLSGITVNGQDITKSIGSGNIAALATLRDTTLPEVQGELDDLAASLRDTINAIANQGSAAPPPNTLTGSESFAATDSLSASGTLRVAVTDADGKVVSTQDIPLAGYATVGDLVADLDAIPGLSASLDADGHLVLAADSAANGVAVAGGTIGGENFSGTFGLNDVLVGSGASDLTVKADLAANSTRFPVGAMSTSGTLAAGDVAVSTGSGTLAQSMADAMRKADLADAAGDLVGKVGSALSSAKTYAGSAETGLTTLIDSFSSKYGVNVDEETALISQLENSYSASAQVISAVKAMFEDLLQAVR